MNRKVLITLIAAALLCCLAGCAEPEVRPETTAAESAPAVLPTASEEETTAPAEETLPPQEIVQPEPRDEDFVLVSAYLPDAVIDLRYATPDNFTNQEIYDFQDVWLRYGTVKKLMPVQEALRKHGYLLKIWDGFRPPAAQFRLWEICPDPVYVSDPNKGFSSHSRGNTVDITIVRTDGTEVEMPTGFDDFTKLADRDYSDCSEEAAENARFLENLMKDWGFQPYSGEWWHFTDTQSYPVEQEFMPVAAAEYYADCQEFISLRTVPDVNGDVIIQIPAGGQFMVLGEHGDFALVQYRNVFGYVLRDYIQLVH